MFANILVIYFYFILGGGVLGKEFEKKVMFVYVLEEIIFKLTVKSCLKSSWGKYILKEEFKFFFSFSEDIFIVSLKSCLKVFGNLGRVIIV